MRVTGSGLGCPEWPTCVGGSIAPTEEMGIHGVIEFANRLLTWVLCAAVGWVIVAARFQREQHTDITRWGWIQFWIVVLNAVVGGITVWARLNPYIVAGHFIAATLLVTAATITWEKVRNLNRPSPVIRLPARTLSLATALVAITAVLIIVGTIVTGAGPHAGDSAQVPRIPVDWTLITVIHGSLAIAAFVIAVGLWRSLKGVSNSPAPRRVQVFLAVFAAQGLIGIVQSLTALPELLVTLHLLGSTLVWIGVLRVFLECKRAYQDPSNDDLQIAEPRNFGVAPDVNPR